VGENDVFSSPKDALNKQIDELNVHIVSLAKEYQNVEYVNTAALLKDEGGALNSVYDVGDGIHLTNDAYRIVLKFLCQQIEQTE
jgi:lysophospholipase L1-like esterase